MSEVVASLQGLAMVAAIWVGCAVGVGMFIIAFANWKNVDKLNDEEDGK